MWHETVFSPLNQNFQDVLNSVNSTPAKGGLSAEELIRRPEISVRQIKKLIPEMEEYEEEVLQEAEIETKYAGYIQKQRFEIERFAKMEDRIIPSNIQYDDIMGLSTEGRQRLKEVYPGNLGQASRITGVTPADISVLMVYLEQKRRGVKNGDC
ncbi:tRNA uridine 5-carboxymethylaminomethyl modification enzyme MnmG [bioreactor metagenome]|uniref:tRNA uridine 5-carboxymethylaminomethyl modification enzyme MnmG n=1 Tax=bioreactor metagenome TaxID=1076179 RepID=A0A645JAA6_9ZZZZ